MSAEYLVKTYDLKTYYLLPKGMLVRAVDGVSIEIAERSFIALVGESGSGKTTLAESLLYLFDPPMVKFGGRVLYRLNVEDITFVKELLNNEEMAKLRSTGLDPEDISDFVRRNEFMRRLRGRILSYVPQYSMDALNPVMKIADFIKDLAKAHGIEVEELLNTVSDLFESVGLKKEYMNRYPHELSGGMRQRAVIAISSAFNPKLMIADEPTSNLDVVKQHEVMDLLTNLYHKARIKSLLVVSHDLGLMLEYAESLFIMYGGHVVEGGARDKMISEPLHPYTKMFIKALPPVGVRITERKLYGVPGTPPDLRFPPPGCRFHPRCLFAMDICRKEVPPLIRFNDGRFVRCWLYVQASNRQ